MWNAECAGRIDDVLATMHPEVTWQPLLRPGRAVFYGHSGIREMRAEVERVLGPPEIVVDDYEMLKDRSVVCRGHAVFRDDRPVLPFEARFTFRDGLIVSVTSYYSDPAKAAVQPE